MSRPTSRSLVDIKLDLLVGLIPEWQLVARMQRSGIWGTNGSFRNFPCIALRSIQATALSREPVPFEADR